MRIAQPKSSNRKTSSRGKKKLADPRQQLIKKFFQVKDAEENGKLESSDRLNLEADNAGLGGAAAGVDPELQARFSRFCLCLEICPDEVYAFMQLNERL